MSQHPLSAPPLFVPPEVINPSNPFHGDLFERRELAERLTGYLQRLKQGAVLAIDAPWGDGKSWFGRHWRAKLVSDGYRTAYLDAFAQDFIDDPFVMIAGELLTMIKVSQSPHQTQFFENSVKIGKVLLPAVSKLAVNAVGHLILGTAGLNEKVQEIGEKLSEASADALEREVTRRLKDYEAEKTSVNGFREALSEVVQSSDTPTIIFVDELDRCRPDFAVQMIERIKHFFDVPGLVFVLLINRNQLCAAIKGVYGQDVDANAYLAKFVHISLTLPKKRSTQLGDRTHNRQFCIATLKRYGFDAENERSNEGTFATALGQLADHFSMSFRDIERAVVLFSLAQPMSALAAYVAWPIALKLKLPEVYGGILKGDPGSHQVAANLLGEKLIQGEDKTAWMLIQALHLQSASPSAHPLNADTSSALRSMGSGLHPEAVLLKLFQRVDLSVSD